MTNFFDLLSYPNDFCQQMYEYYLKMYQNRYYYAYTKHIDITWGHISYWRKQVNFYGRKLMERRLLSISEHKRNKSLVCLNIHLDASTVFVDVVRVRETIK